MDMDAIRNGLSFFGDSPSVQALVVMAVALVLAKVADWTLSRVLSRLTRRTAAEIDGQILEIVHKPIFNTVILMGAALALEILKLPSPFDWICHGIIGSLVILIWLFFGIQLAHIMIDWMGTLERFPIIQNATVPLFEMAAKVVLIAVASYFLLVSWEIDVTGWLASAGIIGIAVGFAARDTLANLFAGVFILADAPYKIGDFVVLPSGERGQVTHIGIRSTRILTRDDVEITVPNSVIGNSKVINESGGPWPKHRIRVPIGVAYGTDIDELRRVLLEVAQSTEHVCDHPEPRVRFRAFGDSSLEFQLLCWVEDPTRKGSVLDALNTGIYKSLGKAEIEIPFPQRDLYIKQVASPPAKNGEDSTQTGLTPAKP